MENEYFLHKNLSYVLIIVGGLDNYEVSFLTQPVHYHHSGIMLLGCAFQSCDEVHRYEFPLKIGNWDWL